MIIPEKEIIRTPVEECFLNDMIEDDIAFIAMESSHAPIIDDEYDSDQGLFDNDVEKMKIRGLLGDDDLDIDDLIGDDEEDIDWDYGEDEDELFDLD